MRECPRPRSGRGAELRRWLASALLLGVALLARPVWMQSGERPLLSSDNAPVPGPRRGGPSEPDPGAAGELFGDVGRNPGSAAHPFSPGRVRHDAPAWFELNHVDPPIPEFGRSFLEPWRPDPVPPPDPRFHDTVRMSDDFRSDDFPAIVSHPDRRDEVWMAWVSYSGRRDELRLARRDPETEVWGAWNPVPGVTGDVWRPSLAFDRDGRLWVLWAQQELFAADFELYARSFDGERWSPLVRLTSSPGGDFDQQVARAPDGTLHVVWQGFRGGQSDIFHRSLGGGRWSEELRVSTSDANDWAPAVAVDSRGAAHVVWDTYDRGDYDVVGRALSDGRLGAPQAVAATDWFEARPAVAVDAEDRVWIAYEIGEEGWGKDQGLLVDAARQPGSRLNAERQVQVRVREGREWVAAKPELATLFAPRRPLHSTTTANPSLSSPQLQVDDGGRVHLVVRALESAGGHAQYWQLYVCTMTERGWSEPALVPWSVGRLSMSAAAIPSAQGGVWLAWPRDNMPSYSVAVMLPEETVIENVYAARFEPEGEAGLSTGAPEPPPFPERGPGHSDEAADVARLRAWRVTVGGDTLQLVRGDTHRHTELSMDRRGVPDGSVLDFYRYMLDAAAMDFGLITDHQGGADREYWWWLEEKLADIFHAPERYVALFGYERSVSYPMGHRNIIHAERGTMPVPFFQKTAYTDLPNVRYHNAPVSVQEDDTELLYESVRKSGGISIPHTSATAMGTDWRDNDPTIEPLVEIFQGDRHSYESPGAPLTDLGAVAQSPTTQVQPAGFVANALERGYKLGFIASSDHLSTHISYAMVWVTERSREAVVDGMRARRAYAATDNIALEFWIGEHFMGEEVALGAAAVPEIKLAAVGTRPFASVEILRNGRVIHAGAPGRAEVEVRFRDLEPEPGTSYYYARLVQQDGQAAWSSPIWVTRP